MAFSCIIANAAPTQRWRPAPKGIQDHGFSRSSARGFEVALGHEGVGVREVLGDPVRHRGARRDELARIDAVSVDVEVLLGHT